MIDFIPSLISEKDNEMLNMESTKEDIKMVVFTLDKNSASGLDELTGHFYHFCWDIIERDMVGVIKAFFQDITLPKLITHTNVILIPKKEKVVSFLDFRLISLSNFVNKVISRLIHDRLETYLPIFISANQYDFIKGRSIVENVLLAQKLIRDIRKMNKVANVVIKVDMAKIYDRVV